MVERAKKSSTTVSLPLNCPRSERGDGGSKSSNAPRRRKRESVCWSLEGRGRSGTLPLNLRFQVGGLRRLRPHSPKLLAGRRGRRGGGVGGAPPASGRREKVKLRGKGWRGLENGWGRRGWRGGEEASVSTGEGTLRPSPEVGSLPLCPLSLSPAPDSAGSGAPSAALLSFLL